MTVNNGSTAWILAIDRRAVPDARETPCFVVATPGGQILRQGKLDAAARCLALDLDAAARSRQDPASLDDPTDTGTKAPGSGARRILRTAWILGALLVMAVVAWQWAEFRGEPWLERPGVQPTLIRLGLQEPPPAGPVRDPDRIHLVSRALTNHPLRPGHLRLSATIVNRAAQKQPYPEIEVTLLDAAGNIVLNRRFTPADYLDPEPAPGAAMAPQAYLPLVLDMEDPGVQAVGFEIQFR